MRVSTSLVVLALGTLLKSVAVSSCSCSQCTTVHTYSTCQSLQCCPDSSPSPPSPTCGITCSQCTDFGHAYSSCQIAGCCPASPSPPSVTIAPSVAPITDQPTSNPTSDSQKCEVGTASPSGQKPCDVCIAGKFADFRGSKQCTECEAGTHLADEATSASLHASQSDCEICKAGSYSTSPASADCTVCGRGKYLVDAATSALAHNSEDQCVSCSAGKYMVDDGEITSFHDEERDCLMCPGGKIPANSTCEFCEEGKFSNSGDVVCSDCAHSEGYVHTASRATCEYCTAGFYANVESQMCVSCEPGKYSVGGVNECLSCNHTEGLVAASVQSTQCETCGAGRYAAKKNDGGGDYYVCEDCALGEVSDGRTDACTPCDKPGEYSAGTRATKCSVVQPGYMIAGASDVGFIFNYGKELSRNQMIRTSEPEKCPSGYASEGMNDEVCTPCGGSEYTDYLDVATLQEVHPELFSTSDIDLARVFWSQGLNPIYDYAFRNDLEYPYVSAPLPAEYYGPGATPGRNYDMSETLLKLTKRSPVCLKCPSFFEGVTGAHYGFYPKRSRVLYFAPFYNNEPAFVNCVPIANNIEGTTNILPTIPEFLQQEEEDWMTDNSHAGKALISQGAMCPPGRYLETRKEYGYGRCYSCPPGKVKEHWGNDMACTCPEGTVMRKTESWKKQVRALEAFYPNMPLFLPLFRPAQDGDMLCESVVAQSTVIASIAVNGLLVSFGCVGLLLFRRSKSRGGGEGSEEMGAEMVREPEIELKGVKPTGLV